MFYFSYFVKPFSILIKFKFYKKNILNISVTLVMLNVTRKQIICKINMVKPKDLSFHKKKILIEYLEKKTKIKYKKKSVIRSDLSGINT